MQVVKTICKDVGRFGFGFILKLCVDKCPFGGKDVYVLFGVLKIDSFQFKWLEFHLQEFTPNY